MALHKFKYVSSELVEHLLNQTIRLTQPDALNDPFEMKRFRKRLIEEATPELWAAPAAATQVIMGQLTRHPTDSPLSAATNALHTLLRSFGHVTKLQGGDPAAALTQNRLSAQAQASFKPLGEVEIRNMRKKAKTFIDKMDRYGILSLTQHDNDLLMWAHYAEEHRGAVLEIDVDDKAFCAPFTTGQVHDEDVDEWRGDVEYPPKRAAPPVSHANFIASFFQKSPQWGYEHEYRIIRRVEKGIKLDGRVDKNRHSIYLFPLPASCIKRVIFGARFDDALRGHLVSFIRSNPELAHVRLSQAQLHQDVYGLEIKQQWGQKRSKGDSRRNLPSSRPALASRRGRLKGGDCTRPARGGRAAEGGSPNE